jgi:hypothetical protein
MELFKKNYKSLGQVNERNFIYDNFCRAVGSAAGIYPSQIGNFNVNAQCLSGDEQ